MVAKIFAIRPTVSTGAIGPAQPGDSNAISSLKGRGVRFHDLTDDLVSRGDGLFYLRKIAFGDMEIRMANSTRQNFQ
jgi:hypothetical protein